MRRTARTASTHLALYLGAKPNVRLEDGLEPVLIFPVKKLENFWIFFAIALNR